MKTALVIAAAALVTGMLLLIGIAVHPCNCYTHEMADKYIKEHSTDPHDYQMDYRDDTLRIYDGSRLVGMHIDTSWNHGAFIDSLIMADNL